MAEVIMPKANDDAYIAHWFFEEGDLVEEGDDLVEISLANGNSFILSSPSPGILEDVCFDEDDLVEADDVLAIIAEEE